MNRISSILDKITNSFIRDNANRRRKKKVTFPLPKVNARPTNFTSVGQVRELQEALRDELMNIHRIAFKPVDPNEEGAIVVEGDDIPDDNGDGPSQ